MVEGAGDRLLDAAATADADALRLALRDGARANAADARKGLSALHMAAGAGDGAELVAELLLHAASCTEDAATRSPTALHELVLTMVNAAAAVPKGATPGHPPLTLALTLTLALALALALALTRCDSTHPCRACGRHAQCANSTASESRPRGGHGQRQHRAVRHA